MKFDRNEFDDLKETTKMHAKNSFFTFRIEQQSKVVKHSYCRRWTIIFFVSIPKNGMLLLIGQLQSICVFVKVKITLSIKWTLYTSIWVFIKEWTMDMKKKLLSVRYA